MSPSYCRSWTSQLLARHMYVSTNTHDSLGIFRVSESHMRVRAGPSKLDRMYLTWLPMNVIQGYAGYHWLQGQVFWSVSRGYLLEPCC